MKCDNVKDGVCLLSGSKCVWDAEPKKETMRIVEHANKTTKHFSVYVEGHREIRVEMHTQDMNSSPPTTFDMWEEVDQDTRTKIIDELIKRDKQ